MRLCAEALQIMSGKGSSLGHPTAGADMQHDAADLTHPLPCPLFIARPVLS